MLTEKKLFKYLFLIFFAVLTGYTFLARASFYDEEGLPHRGNSFLSLRVMGENLAGDYALFRLLEQKTPAREAYTPEKISTFLYKKAHVDGSFSSFASPMKAFIVVPLLNVPYDAFCETWIFLGLLLFGIALYTLLPLKITIPLMFAFPALFLSFISGGWGIFAAAIVIFALTLPEEYPKLAGFLGALSVAEPIVFLFICAVFFVRRQRKAAFFCAGTGILIFLISLNRYGGSAFSSALITAWQTLSENPRRLMSFASVLACSKMPLAVALIFQAALTIGVVYYGVRLFLKPECPQTVQDAYFCAALCLLSPFATLGDYGMLYAGIAFLLRDSMQRGWLKGDFLFLFAAFSSIYVEAFFSAVAGASIQLFLSMVLLRIAYRRSY